MHVLYVCHEYPPAATGGIGPSVRTLARGIARMGHRASVVGFYSEPLVEDDHGVTVYRVRPTKTVRFIHWLLMRRQLRREILAIHARDPIDVIEWPDYEGWFWRPLPQVANVLKVHGTNMSHRLHGLGRRKRLIEWLELRTLRRLRNWIGVSAWFNSEWRQIANVKPAHETVVYNPVDPELFKPSDHRRQPGLVMYAGGLKRRKGVLALARAARIFLKRVPGSQLLLVGAPADLTPQQVCSEAGDMAGRIKFVPHVSQAELVKYLASATVYAMPSLYESCGNTWIEAMSCQTPVVGSWLSCGPEIVEHERTGLLSDPNQPEQIAANVMHLLNNPDRARAMGRAGRQRVLDRFAIDVAAKTSLLFYKQCANVDFAHKRPASTLGIR